MNDVFAPTLYRYDRVKRRYIEVPNSIWSFDFDYCQFNLFPVATTEDKFLYDKEALNGYLFEDIKQLYDYYTICDKNSINSFLKFNSYLTEHRIVDIYRNPSVKYLKDNKYTLKMIEIIEFMINHSLKDLKAKHKEYVHIRLFAYSISAEGWYRAQDIKIEHGDII